MGPRGPPGPPLMVKYGRDEQTGTQRHGCKEKQNVNLPLLLLTLLLLLLLLVLPSAPLTQK